MKWNAYRRDCPRPHIGFQGEVEASSKEEAEAKALEQFGFPCIVESVKEKPNVPSERYSNPKTSG